MFLVVRNLLEKTRPVPPRGSELASLRKATRSGKDLFRGDEVGFSTFVLRNTIRDLGVPGDLNVRIGISINRLKQFLGELRPLLDSERLSLLREFFEQGRHGCSSGADEEVYVEAAEDGVVRVRVDLSKRVIEVRTGDSAAICEAAGRPLMRFVPGQRADLALFVTSARGATISRQSLSACGDTQVFA
jgi:hypothetical protein